MYIPNPHFIVIIDKVDKLRFEITNAYHLAINLLRNKSSLRHSVATGVVEGKNGAIPFAFKTRIPYSKYLLLQFQLFNIHNILIGQYTLDTSNFNKDFNTLRAQLRLEKPDRTRNGNLHVYIELRQSLFSAVKRNLCFIKPIAKPPELAPVAKANLCKDIEISDTYETINSPAIRELEPTTVQSINLFLTNLKPSTMSLFQKPYISVSIGEYLYGSPLLSDCEVTSLGSHISSYIYYNEPYCSIILWEFVCEGEDAPCLKIATGTLKLSKACTSAIPIRFKLHQVKCINTSNHMDHVLLTYHFDVAIKWFDASINITKSVYPSVNSALSPSLPSPPIDYRKNPLLNNLSVCRKPVKVIRTSQFNKTDISNVIFKCDYERKTKPLNSIETYFIMRLVFFCLSDIGKNETFSLKIYIGNYMTTISATRNDYNQSLAYFSFSPIILISSHDRYMTFELVSDQVKELKQYKMNLSSFFMEPHSIYCGSVAFETKKPYCSNEFSQLIFQCETIQTSLEFVRETFFNQSKQEKEILTLDTFNVNASPCARTSSTHASSISPVLDNCQNSNLLPIETPVLAKFSEKSPANSLASVPVEFPFLDENYKKWKHFIQNSV